jgi:hypothetical protein
MKIYVELLAFGNGEMRPVEVPDDKITDDPMEVLELVFHYGQNDFQPLPFPSVSAGDVVHYGSKTYMVDFIGFSIADDQLEAMREVVRSRSPKR